MKYRSRAEIVSQILEAAKQDLVGTSKTNIMYHACLSFTQLREYLKLVLNRELLEYDKANRRYRLTEKGIEYLEMFHHTRSLIDL